MNIYLLGTLTIEIPEEPACVFDLVWSKREQAVEMIDICIE